MAMAWPLSGIYHHRICRGHGLAIASGSETWVPRLPGSGSCVTAMTNQAGASEPLVIDQSIHLLVFFFCRHVHDHRKLAVEPDVSGCLCTFSACLGGGSSFSESEIFVFQAISYFVKVYFKCLPFNGSVARLSTSWYPALTHIRPGLSLDPQPSCLERTPTELFLN